jgi:hypothetical protein
MAPGDVLVVADEHDGNARPQRAGGVQLAGDGELRLVEAVGAAPVPVRVAEEHGLPVGRALGAEADHVAAHAVLAPEVQRQRSQARRGGGASRLGIGGRRGGVGDGLDEVAVAASEHGVVEAAPDVACLDGRHPRFAAAGRLRAASRRTGLELQHVAVVAGHVAVDQLADRIALRGRHGRDPGLGHHVPVEEVGVEVARPADGAFVHRLRLATEPARAFAAVGQEGIGQRAEHVLRLRVAHAVAQALPVVRLDEGHAKRAAADLGGVRRVVRAAAAGHRGQRRQQQRASAGAAPP